jgi:hypothetical protein
MANGEFDPSKLESVFDPRLGKVAEITDNEKTVGPNGNTDTQKHAIRKSVTPEDGQEWLNNIATLALKEGGISKPSIGTMFYLGIIQRLVYLSDGGWRILSEVPPSAFMEREIYKREQAAKETTKGLVPPRGPI